MMFKFKPKKMTAEQMKDAREGKSNMVREWKTKSSEILTDEEKAKAVVPDLPSHVTFTLSALMRAKSGSNAREGMLSGDVIAGAIREFGHFIHSVDFSNKTDVLFRLGEGMPDLQQMLDDMRNLDPTEYNSKWGLPLACSVMALSAVFERIMSNPDDYNNLRAIWTEVTTSMEGKNP
jgi:hypothetical protein